MSHVTHKLNDGSFWCQTHERYLSTCEAVEAERKACADLAAAYHDRNHIAQPDFRARADEAKEISAAIRARSNS